MTNAKTPTIVKDETAAMDLIASDTTRSRPVIAINDNGQLVVCCKTTAKKHGWEVQGKLYSRIRSGKRATINTKGELVAEVAALQPEPKAKTPRTQARRKADVQVAKAVKVMHTVEELLK